MREAAQGRPLAVRARRRRAGAPAGVGAAVAAFAATAGSGTKRCPCACGPRVPPLQGRPALPRLQPPRRAGGVGREEPQQPDPPVDGLAGRGISRRGAAAVAAAVGSLGASAYGFLRGGHAEQAIAATLAESAVREAVEKSPLDARSYEAAVLENGLRVLLVSDPDSDRAAAALNVHVGYFSDPEILPGLAHFNEHMLFLGTEKFPEPNSFDAFLSSSSGYSNAFTDAEDTCFFFTCGAEALPAGLERFGAFFSCPLFTPDATEREVGAINSEHLKNLQSDVFRLSQVTQSRANLEHPYHKFGTGTRATLMRKDVDLRAALIEHYKQYYCSDLMTLCIIGREGLKDLAGIAARYFGQLPRADSANLPPVQLPVAAAWAGIPPFLPSAFEQEVDAVPVSDARVLEVSFPIRFSLPSSSTAQTATGGFEAAGTLPQKTWRELTPQVHIGSVFGHEGPKSLCSMLRRRAWATGLDCAVNEDNDSFALISVSIDLTSEGFARRAEVLELLFGYIRLFREAPKWPSELLEENVLLSEAGWRSSEPPAVNDAAVRLASNMQRFTRASLYVSGGARLRSSPELPELVQAVARELTPSNALVTVISRSFAGAKGQSIEPWYGTPYSTRSIVGERAKWEAARPAPGLAFPSLNPFLPRSLELKAPRALRDLRGVTAEPPNLRRRDKKWEVFHRLDTQYGTPKAYACMELFTPFPRTSVRVAVIARLYEMLLQYSLIETLTYDARVAGLRFEITTSVRGVQLFFGGFDDRLVDFTRASMQAVRDFDPAADPSCFESQRDLLAQEFASFPSEQPFQQAGYWTGLATTVPDYSIEELQAELPKVTLADVVGYAERLLTKEPLYGLALCQGNILGSEVDRLVAAVEDALRFQPLPQAEWPLPGIAQVPVQSVGPGYVLSRDALDPVEKNSAVELSYFAGTARKADGDAGLRRFASVQALAAVLRERFYTELRTKQQLGYIVECFADKREGVCRMVFIVQGAVLDPVAVLGRVDAFLTGARRSIEDKSEAEVQGLSASLAEARLTRPQQLGEAVEIDWLEIRSREFRWSRPLDEAAALRRVRRADVLFAYDRLLAEGGAARHRLATLIFGAAHRGSRAAGESLLKAQGAVLIEDAQAFAVAQPRWTPGVTGGV